ncbi:ABC transporter permease [Escherichia coli]|uniref:ABC transporter permease n=1 Tax=Escherichia coli TaxID=562 RepID=UPI000F877083|nr:ABC transporter permease [Escherichia coli]EEX0621662.1 hypothetical protein [Escherichia coli]EFG6863759.1 ABC transporter permease [Escherichia coli]EFG8594290.1 ABC transporter permease [Escherichia coli]EFH5808728.1 hypothetical protein [Escherichia coli]EFN2499651.1 ABC transporter permease [Escherichia coli]
MILQFSMYDLKKKVAGSYFGWFWLIMKPLLTILVMWAVFSYGFKTPAVDGSAFIVWVASGLVVWTFFSETINDMTNSLIEYNYLLRQTNFKSKNILSIKLLSNSFLHMSLFSLLFVIYALSGGAAKLSLLLMFYYFISLVAFTYSLGLLLSSLRVFIKDISDMLNAVLQVAFWATPVIWNIKLIPKEYVYILNLNPLSYVVQGYRDILVNQNAPLNTLGNGVVFWCEIIVLYIGASFVFHRLERQFNDVL